MVQTLAYCLGNVAPYYNMVLGVFIIFLFLRFFKTCGKKTYLKPWKFLLAAVVIYLGEEIITLFDMSGVIMVNKLVFPLLEMAIITLFIYILLLQREKSIK